MLEAHELDLLDALQRLRKERASRVLFVDVIALKAQCIGIACTGEHSFVQFQLSLQYASADRLLRELDKVIDDSFDHGHIGRETD